MFRKRYIYFFELNIFFSILFSKRKISQRDLILETMVSLYIFNYLQSSSKDIPCSPPLSSALFSIRVRFVFSITGRFRETDEPFRTRHSNYRRIDRRKCIEHQTTPELWERGRKRSSIITVIYEHFDVAQFAGNKCAIS